MREAGNANPASVPSMRGAPRLNGPVRALRVELLQGIERSPFRIGRRGRRMRQASPLLVTFLFLLAGCASLQPLDRPQDFPFHATDHPSFNLHWRLTRGEGAVRAVGLVEATRQGKFSAVYLELRGLDNQGHVVSRGLGRTWAPLQGETFPFSVSLRATGAEDRFELIVWGYDWPASGS